MKIETHRPRAPWSWVAWMVFPWVSFNYVEMCSGAPLVFTMRKFIEDPALIGLLSSLNIAFNFGIGTVTSYMSDRIWTRWGRRRPFLIVGWTGLAVTLFLIPLADSVTTLVVAIILYQFFQDIAKPYEPLYNEVIPPAQRGRAGMLRNLVQNASAVFFNAVLIAQFDRSYDLAALGASFTITGEMMLYWTIGLLIAATVLFLLFMVRETPPPGGIRREPFRLGVFFRDIFGHRQWWMVYLLYACPIIAGAGLGGGVSTFLPLFLSEQLHFTKPQIGGLLSVVMILNTVIFVPLAGFLADRWSRLRLFQIGLIGQGTAIFCFYLYTRLTGFDVSFGLAVAFLAVNNAFVYLVFVLWGPLIYDYIPSNQFGTVSAGFSFTGGLAGFLVINASGLWVKGYTALFHPDQSGADYSSAFILQFFAGILALLAALYFERAVRRGQVKALGVLEFTPQEAGGPPAPDRSNC